MVSMIYKRISSSRAVLLQVHGTNPNMDFTHKCECTTFTSDEELSRQIEGLEEVDASAWRNLTKKFWDQSQQKSSLPPQALKMADDLSHWKHPAMLLMYQRVNPITCNILQVYENPSYDFTYRHERVTLPTKDQLDHSIEAFEKVNTMAWYNLFVAFLEQSAQATYYHVHQAVPQFRSRSISDRIKTFFGL